MSYKEDARKIVSLYGTGKAVNYNEFISENEEYKASETASKALISEYYAGDASRTYRTQELSSYDSLGSGYYGRYLGQMYYTGNKGNDVVAKVKVNKVLDYVDNDITFSPAENTGTDHLWAATSSKILVDSGLVNGPAPLVDDHGIRYSTNDDNLIDNKELSSHLAVSVDDRTSASGEAINNKLSKYLLPEKVNDENSFGVITLVTSKVIGSETDTENMEYDNAAEIIEYTSQTGRTTPLKTALTAQALQQLEAKGISIGQTVGNANPNGGVPSSITPDNTDEIDTAFSETVILAPPTGTRIAKYYTEVYMIKLLNSLVVIVSIIIAILTANKAKHYKKFYK